MARIPTDDIYYYPVPFMGLTPNLGYSRSRNICSQLVVIG